MVRFWGGRQSWADVAVPSLARGIVGRGIAARPPAPLASTTVVHWLACACPAEGTVGGVRVGAIVGTCEAMCPAPERERRARLSDIQVGAALCCAVLDPSAAGISSRSICMAYIPWLTCMLYALGCHFRLPAQNCMHPTTVCTVSLGLQIFERTDLNNSAETSAALAVKRFARTVSRNQTEGG